MEADAPTQLQQWTQVITGQIRQHQYKKVVLQMPKELLHLSFDLTNMLRKNNEGVSFFLLYDSLKQPCCLDELGASHVGCDCLVHFGDACFSSPHQPHHIYLHPSPQPERAQTIAKILNDPSLSQDLDQRHIGYILAQQTYYNLTTIITKKLNIKAQVLKLPYDAAPEDHYLMFGYHFTPAEGKPNILVIADEEQEDEEFPFTAKMAFSLKNLEAKVGQSLYTVSTDSQSPSIQPYEWNGNKKLMQRYSMATQLSDHSVFGLIVSNTGTAFAKTAVARCESILRRRHKKVFTFMMNNLNEVKMGNFPEIDVYVVISCFNNSMYGLKDFHRLVVTLTDIEVAFAGRSFDDYSFDLRSEPPTLPQMKEEERDREEEEILAMEVKKGGEVMLQNKVQTLDRYRDKEYKGLDFSQKKEPSVLKKGKMGLAEQYEPLK